MGAGGKGRSKDQRGGRLLLVPRPCSLPLPLPLPAFPPCRRRCCFSCRSLPVLPFWRSLLGFRREEERLGWKRKRVSLAVLLRPWFSFLSPRRLIEVSSLFLFWIVIVLVLEDTQRRQSHIDRSFKCQKKSRLLSSSATLSASRPTLTSSPVSTALQTPAVSSLSPFVW